VLIIPLGKPYLSSRKKVKLLRGGETRGKEKK